MFKTRLLSGIVLVIVLIGTVGYGGNLLFGLLAVVSLIGMSELYKVVGVQKKILGFCRISCGGRVLRGAVYQRYGAHDDGVYPFPDPGNGHLRLCLSGI